MGGMVVQSNQPKIYWNGREYGSMAERDAAIQTYTNKNHAVHGGDVSYSPGPMGATSPNLPDVDVSMASPHNMANPALAGLKASNPVVSATMGASQASQAPEPDHNTLRAEQMQDEERHLGQIPQLLGAVGAGQNAAPIAPVTYPDQSGARDAAFARAKDKIGQTGRAAADTLANLYSQRGMSGGGLEQRATSQLAGQQAGMQGDLVREQLMQDLDQSQHLGDMNYQGGITQRGQDIAQQGQLRGLLPSLLGLVQSGRGIY